RSNSDGSLRNKLSCKPGQGIVVAFGPAILGVYALALCAVYLTQTLAKCGSVEIIGTAMSLLAIEIPLMRWAFTPRRSTNHWGGSTMKTKSGWGASMLGGIYGVLALAISVTLGPAAWAGPSLLFDVTNGAVLYAEDVDTLWHPASLTKMMTAYVTFVAIQDGT